MRGESERRRQCHLRDSSLQSISTNLRLVKVEVKSCKPPSPGIPEQSSLNTLSTELMTCILTLACLQLIETLATPFTNLYKLIDTGQIRVGVKIASSA